MASNPSMDVVHAHIKSITQCIQELLQAAQAHRQARWVGGWVGREGEGEEAEGEEGDGGREEEREGERVSVRVSS